VHIFRKNQKNDSVK